MHTDLISIIIPVHNGEKYIIHLIERILNNPHKNVEILIGDDASTDGSKEILKSYENHERVKVLSLPTNVGPGSMRNQLIKMSSGNFIALQDIDDTFHTNRFLDQLNFLKSNPGVHAVGTGALLFSKKDGFQWGEITRKEEPKLLDWLTQSSVIHASVMFRREVLSHCAYKENIRLGEDFYFLTELYTNKVKFHNLLEPLYYYYVDKDDLKTRAFKKYKAILQSIFVISKLFPIYLRPVFITLNYIKLNIGYFRGWRSIK
jgi:glycosyltransferase involved in cell wall biosynthesis